MKKFIHDFTVLSNTRLNQKYFVLELHASAPLPRIEPGQFAAVLVPNPAEVFLRRPFSIHDVDFTKNTIKLFIKIVGKGTEALSQIQTGETLNLIYPLGKGFQIPRQSKILVVGGGCGIAPLLFLVHALHSKGIGCDILLGGHSADDLIIFEQFAKYGSIHLMTEDGSAGEKGLVTQHPLLGNSIIEFHTIFACGPTPMLKAISDLAARHYIECQVSLENTMACGIGACLCCVVKTTSGNRCVCTEGPVFDTKELAGWHQPMVKCDL